MIQLKIFENHNSQPIKIEAPTLDDAIMILINKGMININKLAKISNTHRPT